MGTGRKWAQREIQIQIRVFHQRIHISDWSGRGGKSFLGVSVRGFDSVGGWFGWCGGAEEGKGGGREGGKEGGLLVELGLA